MTQLGKKAAKSARSDKTTSKLRNKSPHGVGGAAVTLNELAGASHTREGLEIVPYL